MVSKIWKKFTESQISDTFFPKKQVLWFEIIENIEKKLDFCWNEIF